MVIAVAWAWAYHQNVAAAVDAWKASVSVYDGLMGSLLSGDPTASDGEMGDPEPPPVIIVATATAEPAPVAAASTTTPVQASPPRKTSTPVSAATPEGTPVRVVVSLVPVVPSVTSPTPTPVPPPNLRHLEFKQYMLELINTERLRAGVGAVVLGDNIAAQLHAEDSLAGCYSSHWGRDGLKPYMRYTLAGGYQSNNENGSGLGYCITSETRSPGGHRYSQLGAIKTEIRETMEGLMSSPGHRANILRPRHGKVNIGMAWDPYNMFAVQHFEGGHVEFTEPPRIDSDAHLTLVGMVRNEVTVDREKMGAQIYFDPPPHELTRGQLTRTYCYDSGLLIAGLRPPPGQNAYYTEHSRKRVVDRCPSPYDIPAGSPGPDSPGEAREFWQQAKDTPRPTVGIEYLLITMTGWSVSGDSFSISGSLKELLDRWGSGVYTLMLWGDLDGDSIPVAQYAIFHGITPPDTYTP